MFGKSGSVLRFYKNISIACLISASGVTGAGAQASLEVDMEKISRVAGEFHVRFFDEDSRLLDLNEAEIRTYFEREKGAPPGPVTYEIGEDDRPAGEGAKEGDDPASKGALALGYTKRCRDADLSAIAACCAAMEAAQGSAKRQDFQCPGLQPGAGLAVQDREGHLHRLAAVQQG